MKKVFEQNINPVKWLSGQLEKQYRRGDRNVILDEVNARVSYDGNILNVGAGGGVGMRKLREGGHNNIIDCCDY